MKPTSKRPDLDLVAGFDRDLGGGRDVVLLQAAFEDAQRQPGAVDRYVELFEDIGKRPDVVLVAVGQDDGPHDVLVIQEIGYVGNDEVDSEHVVLREHQAAVNHDDIVTITDNRQVFTDFTQPAQGNDLKFFGV